MRAADIERLIAVGRPDAAPDGSFAVFATSRPDVAANRYVGQVWRVDLPGGVPRRLTRGTADSGPRLCPDGSRVAFRRPDEKGRPQLHVMWSGGGEPVQVTDAPLGVGDIAWSPDGARLAFTARVPEEGRYGTVDGLEATAEAPRRITGIRWHANGLGYVADRPAHIFIVDAPDLDGEPAYPPAAAVGDRVEPVSVPNAARQLTRGADSHVGVVFRGDDLLTVAETIEQDRRDLSSRLLAIPADGGDATTLVDASARLSISDVAVAGDGAVAILASATGESGVDFVAPGVALRLVRGDGGIDVLTDPEGTDLGEVGSHISVAGRDFLVQNRTRGRVHLLRVSRSGEVEPLVEGDVEVGGHAVSGSRIVVAVAQPASFGELLLVEGGETVQLSEFGEAAAASGIADVAEVTTDGRAGYPVHGWVAVPAGEGPHPVLLQIHGGPYASYGIHLFDETQVLVDAGYAVVYCNPRGSAGYGRSHGRRIRHAMGTVDMDDVLDFLDGVVGTDDRLDADRVGIMGGSYGGYLTAWITAHDHRFAAAIVERGFLDPASFQGTSDIGSFFGDEYVGTSAADIAAQSPMAVVERVTTPTLVLHSELDFRCPLEQATRYYSALKRQGTTAELLIFPGEDHELTRAGQPRHRLQRFDAVLDWWSRFLPVR